MNRYADILHLPHPVSQKRPAMPNHDRAAQFAPFAALTGHDAAIVEAGRLTDLPIYLCDSALEELNAQLRQLIDNLEQRPVVCIRCFHPDTRKAGGANITITGIVRRVDLYNHVLQLEDGREVPMEGILAIRFVEPWEKL